MINDVSANALDAIQRAHNSSAHNVANALTEGFEPSSAVFQPSETAGVSVKVRHGKNAADDRREATEESAETRQPSGADLAEESVKQITYSVTFKANAAAIKTQNQITGTLIDVLA